MAKKKKAPEFTHCKVTLTTHPRAPWRVSYPVEESGVTRRKRRMFSTEDRALKFATAHEKEVEDFGVRFGSITAEARRAFDFYRDAKHDLLGEGIDVPPFETLVTDAVNRLRAEAEERRRALVTVAEAVEAFKDYKRPRVGKAHLSALTTHLGSFAKVFGTVPLDKVAAGEIEQWLGTLRTAGENPQILNPATRNRYRKSLKALFAYGMARAQGWCHANPMADIHPEKQRTDEPQAYTPDEARRIMLAAQGSPILPAITLGMFCGLRPSEAQSLDLAVIDLDAEEFRTPAFHPAGEPTKTGARIAPLTAPAKAFLASQARRKGLAWTGDSTAYLRELKAVLKAAKVKGIFDGLRHSFITYRTAGLRDVARVADECGNSPDIIKRHYRELTSAAEAEKFFAIQPEAPAENVTRMEGRASA